MTEQKPKLYIERQGDGVWIVPEGAMYVPNLETASESLNVGQPSYHKGYYLLPVPAEERLMVLKPDYDHWQIGDLQETGLGYNIRLIETSPLIGYPVEPQHPKGYRRMTFPDFSAQPSSNQQSYKPEKR